jgi:hypothetical protein
MDMANTVVDTTVDIVAVTAVVTAAGGEMGVMSAVSDILVGMGVKFGILKARMFMFGEEVHGFTPTMRVN